MKKIKLTIEGMHCASCASNIERGLKKLEGVKEVSISVMTKKGFIEVDENAKISEGDLKKAIEKVGYKLTKVEE